MKKQKLRAKLSLNKETLGSLTQNQMQMVKGGETIDFCNDTYQHTTCQAPSLRGDSQGAGCTDSWCACY